MGVAERFSKRYGWLYTTKEIADLKGIPMDQVFEMSITEAFNMMSYLKAKAHMEKEVLKQWHQ